MALRYTLLRHAGAAEADAEHRWRQLTAIGLAQSYARRDELKRDFDLVISSTAERAKKTAEIVGSAEGEVIILDSLYLPTNAALKAELICLFGTKGDAPFRAYREADITQAFKLYGEKAEADIRRLVTDFAAKEILVVGHDLLLNAVAAEIIGEDTDEVLNTRFGECEGIEVTFTPVVRVIK